MTWGARSLSPADRIRRKMPAAATRLAKYKRTTGNFRVKSGGMRATRESFPRTGKGCGLYGHGVSSESLGGSFSRRRCSSIRFACLRLRSVLAVFQ